MQHLVLIYVDVNSGAHLLLCCSENGKDAVSEMSTDCVNAFQWLTQLTVGTIFANLTSFTFSKEMKNIQRVQTCMLSTGRALYQEAELTSC